jgi:transcriptional regulator with XRE-family HTH domain
MGRARLPTHQGGTGGEEHMTGNDEGERGYVIKVGAWIRSIRCQQQLSLQDVEAASDHEYKASVLGAYERGERAISVPRLQRLARFYRVPVDQMLPHDDELGLPSANGNAPVVDLTERVRRRPVTLDLQAIEQMGGHEGEMLRRYLRLIQWQRGDYNGRMLTIRRDDQRTVACIFDCHLEQVPARLDSLRLLLVP